MSIDDEVPAILSSSNGSKNKQEEMLEDATKKLRDLQLNYKKVDKILSFVNSTQTLQRQDSQKWDESKPMKKQCIWCNVEDHKMTQDCDQFQEATAKNLVF